MALDIEKYLQPISDDAPCGVNLEYDPDYMAMEQSAQGTAEHQVGDTIIQAEEPNWRDIRKTSLALMDKGRDLRVVMYLTLSSLRIDGLSGFRDGMVLLNRLMQERWDTVWPQLDPDDDNDPLERMNIVSSLAPQPGAYQDPMMFPQRLQAAPLSKSAQLGSYSLRDIMVAQGEITSTDTDKTPDQALIDASFEDTPIEILQENSSAINEALEAAKSLDDYLTATVGAGNAPDFSRLVRELTEIQRVMTGALERRGYGAEAVSDDEVADEEAGESTAGQSSAAPKASVGLSGDISSRREVLLAIDKITRYYEKYEPSSPVPLIIKRAKRMVDMSFLDILRDLTPDSLDGVQNVFGSQEQESES